VRFTHHAKNGLRWVKGTAQEAESVVENPIEKSFGMSGKPRYLGVVGREFVWVVVALDEPDLIVTIFREERR
jgi:hypothetical protein